MKNRVLVFFASALLAFSAFADSQFVIARGKTANVAICVPKGAGAPTRHAAEALAKYLGEMSGAKFKVVSGKGGAAKSIVVGAPYASEHEEEVCLRVSKDGRTLSVTGEGPRGPVFAVYTLLQRLGCGFWTPTRETVPHPKEIAVPASLDVVERPAFVVRQPAGACAGRNPEWAMRIRVNGDMYVPPIPSEIGGHRQYDISQCKLGLEDDEALFAKHPELYALRDGGRSRQHLCNTSPATRAEIVRRVKERLKAEPDTNQIAIGINDGADFCQCPACSKLRQQEGGQIGPELDLCNYVARQFAKSNPKTRFLVFAYESTLKPPKKMKCEPNVDVCFAYIQRNYARPPSGTPDHDALLAAWSKLTGDNVYVWGYNAQFKDFQMPWPIIDTMGPEMRTYRDHKVKGVYVQMANDPGSDFQALRTWLAAQLMWNPDQDEMKLMEQWCDGACGKGGKFVFEWLEACRRAREATKWLGVYSSDSRLVLKPADILKGDALLAKAEAATKDDPGALAEVRRIRNSLTHVMLVRYNEDLALAAKKAGVAIPSRGELVQKLVEAKPGIWNEGNIWRNTFLPRIRHGEVQLERRGVLIPKTGLWTFRNPMTKDTLEDPFVVYDDASKWYYRILTVGGGTPTLPEGGEEFRIRRAKKLVDLFEPKCNERVLWKPGPRDPVASGLRGPELVRGADGVWRVWACGVAGGGRSGVPSSAKKSSSKKKSAGRAGVPSPAAGRDGVPSPSASGASRLFLLEGGKDPFAANSFRFAGEVCAKDVASGPTVFRMPDGKWYLFYSREQGAKAGIVAHELLAPGKVSVSEGVVLSAGRSGVPSPAAPRSPALVQMGKDVYLLYCANADDLAQSEIRALKYRGGDPTKAKSWEACEKPVVTSGIAFKDIKRTFLTGPRAPSVFRSADGSEAWIAFRGWSTKAPANAPKGAIMCVQRLDDGISKDALLFDTAAEMCILLIQPSGDYDLSSLPK